MRFGNDAFRENAQSYQVGAYGGLALGGAFAQAHLGYGSDKHRLSRTGVAGNMTARPDGTHVLAGAKGAYEMIVLAFANGDRRALKDLLSPDVYESFEAVIKDREKHEQKTETRFVSIDKAELVGAEARDRAAQLTVRFVSQMISVTRDKTGAIVDGNPDKVADITDVWTFARDTSSRDPNWKLVATEAGH